MVLNARLGNVVFDSVSRTLILNEHFNLFFILDVICCVKLQQLPTHSLQHSLSKHWCSIFICSSWEPTGRESDNYPLVTKQIPNLKIKIYDQNVLYFSTLSSNSDSKFVSILFTIQSTRILNWYWVHKLELWGKSFVLFCTKVT